VGGSLVQATTIEVSNTDSQRTTGAQVAFFMVQHLGAASRRRVLAIIRGAAGRRRRRWVEPKLALGRGRRLTIP